MPPSGGTRTAISLQARLSATGTLGATTTFPPGTPLSPINPGNPVRSYDFPVSVNTLVTPRTGEPFDFRHLKAFANVEPVRLAIETRKDQIERLDWKIKPRDEKQARNDTSVKPRSSTVEKFLRKPDGATPFSTWLRQLLEDLLSLDAPALECVRTRGGQLIGLELVPGETIHPMVDETGRRPRDPTAVAYQQVIKGLSWVNLTNRDMIYAPRNPRPNHLYGFGPVEQIIVTIQTVIRRQARQLAYFTEGNVPAGILNGPEGWNPDQVKDMQTWLDGRLTGQTAEQVKLLFMPAGTKYASFKEAPLKDEFDEWLYRVVAFAFSLPPTPFVRQMNRATAGEDQERGLEEGLEPIKLWVKRLLDAVIQDELGHEDLEFSWNDEAEVDRVQQAEIDDKSVRNGTSTIDEVRDRRGQEPLPNGEGAKAMVFATTGPVTLEKIMADEAAPPPEPVVAAPIAGQVADPAKPEPAPTKPKPKPAEKLAKLSGAISGDRPKARRAKIAMRKALEPILKKAGDEAAADVAMHLRALHKAADDTGDFMAQAAKIAALADLSAFAAIVEAVYDDLFEIADDSGVLALAGVGLSDQALVDQVNARAVDFAKARAAELVSIDGDKNLIAATREAIRATIVSGLEDNLGASAIADNIQASYAFSADRAAVIAQNEIANANGQGKLSGWKEAQATGLVITKSWQTVGDEDVDEVCEDNEAQGSIPLDDDFASGDSAEPAHVNCRCVTTASASDPEAE